MSAARSRTGRPVRLARRILVWPFDQLVHRVRRLWGRVARAPILPWTNWAPSVDLLDQGEEVLAYVEMPGLDPDQMEVTVVGHTVRVKGNRREARARSYLREELYHGTFEREFELPEEVDPERLSAEYDKGILILRVPKSDSARPRRVEVLPRERP